MGIVGAEGPNERASNPHCKNGPRMWLKVRNKRAVPVVIQFYCGDIYRRSNKRIAGGLAEFTRQSAGGYSMPHDTIKWDGGRPKPQ